MPHVLVHQRIEDFDRWKEVFDRLGPARAAASCRSTAVFRNREDPHEVVVLFEFDDLARAREHMGSAELRAAWQDAGVTDPGTRSILDLVPLDGVPLDGVPLDGVPLDGVPLDGVSDAGA